jgi:hypothetical protein
VLSAPRDDGLHVTSERNVWDARSWHAPCIPRPGTRDAPRAATTTGACPPRLEELARAVLELVHAQARAPPRQPGTGDDKNTSAPARRLGHAGGGGLEGVRAYTRQPASRAVEITSAFCA